MTLLNGMHNRARGKARNRCAWLAAVAGVAVAPSLASAQSAAPGATVELETIVVEGIIVDTETTPPTAAPQPASSPAPASTAGTAGPAPGAVAPAVAAAAPVAPGPSSMSAEAVAREKLAALPGGASLISADELEGRANVTVADALKSTPGVVVQSFFGGNDQPRIQIRGSGLQQNPVERGILVLQDGLPINRADGSYIVGFADPRSAQFIEVYRGYTANRLGATVLGGAINFASPTGASDPGVSYTIEAGSFGQFTTTAGIGVQEGDLDGHGTVSFSTRDGFRDRNSSERVNVNINTGARITDNITSRLFLGYTDLGFDVAGPLSKGLLEDDPTQVCVGPPTCLGPNVVRDKPRRDATQFRAGSRTSARFGDNLIDVALGYTYTDDSFRFPIPGGVRDTEGGDFTAVARYAYAPDKSQPLPLFETTAQYVIGEADREYFINENGARGEQFGENDLEATTLSLYAGLNVPLGHGFTVSPAISYSYATRDNDDLFDTTAPRPTLSFTPVPAPDALAQDTSYSRSYSGWTPSLGLSYQLAPASTIFGAVSRSFEPPTHDDLISTRGGNPNASPGVNGTPAFATPDLDAQTATTIEAGWRGKTETFSWDAVVYYSWLEDELLNLRDPSGTPLGAVNADETTHFGVELGLAARFSEKLSGRVTYTYQDFRFETDPDGIGPVEAGNRMAGAPRHQINAALRYAFTPDLFVEGEVDWRPDETPVDNANTLFNDEFAIFNLRANYDLYEQFRIFGEVRNVFDKTYASSTLIADDAQGNVARAAFLPGDGRAFILGVSGKF